jgi:UDP-glucuronate 4-epimerase
MRILLTGGAGFIGSLLAERMLASRHEVWAVDNFDPYYNPKIKRRNLKKALASRNFRLLEGDIRDRRFLEGVFKKAEFDQVIHLAAKAGVRSSLKDPISYADVNINGTVNLLEACRQHQVKDFIFGSSSSVYGDCKIPYRETEKQLNPLSPYGVTKLGGEQICSIYHRLYGMNMAVLRFFTVYGPRQRPDMAIHKFTKLIQSGKPIQIYGRGDSQRDYTYIDDIISGIMTVMEKRFACEIINLGNSRKVKLLNLIRILEAKLQKKAKLRFLPQEKAEPKVTWASISKASRLLNYKPATSIEEGIDHFLRWYEHA